VPQKVSDAAQLRPRNLWTQLFGHLAEFLCGLADPFQAPLHRIARLPVLREGSQVHPGGEFLNQVMFSRMSSKR
jgi:hypothetical protein